MAEQKTSIKTGQAVDLSESIGGSLSQKINPLEATVDIQLPGVKRNSEKAPQVDPARIPVSVPKATDLETLAPSKSVSTKEQVAPEPVVKTARPIEIEKNLDTEIEAQRSKFSPNLNPSLKGESFSFKPKTGYVDTILDTLMNLLAELLTRIDRLLFKRKGRGKNNSDPQTAREAELEEFMEARVRTSFKRPSAKKSRRSESEMQQERREKQDKLAEEISLDQSWQGDD